MGYKVEVPIRLCWMAYMRKEALLAEMQGRCMLESEDPDEVAGWKKDRLLRHFYSVVNQAEALLENEAFANNTQRTKGDIDRYFGFDWPKASEATPEPEVTEPEVTEPEPITEDEPVEELAALIQPRKPRKARKSRKSA